MGSLAPGAQREVKVTAGKPVTVEVKGKDVTAKLEDNKIVIAAGNRAKGTNVVRVLDANGKSEEVTVRIARSKTR